MNRLVGVLWFFLLAGSVAAQVRSKKNKGDADFKAALQALKQERYQEALAAFSALTKDQENQERSVYSHYYYANAAQHLNKDKEGLNMLQQLLSRYPNWAQKDEVFYLAGLLNFKLKNYYRALDYLHRISTSSFQKDVGGLKQRYLAAVTDIGTLKGLHKQFPNDRILAGCLVKAISAKPSPAKSDAELAKNLVSRFKLSGGEAVTAVKEDKTGDARKSKTDPGKKHRDVAVLLPFRIEAFDAASRNRVNQYVFDYYQGLLMAQTTLMKEGIDIRLNAFDIGNIRHSVENLTQTDEFRNCDLVLGPLHLETSEEAAEYSRKSGIPVINPLSTDSKLLSNRYPHYFLAHASLGLQARQAAKVAKSIDDQISVVIYYGESQKDSSLAMLYEEEVRAMGGKVLGMSRIGGTSEAIASVLTQQDNPKPSHVALFSTDAKSGRAFLNLMRGAGYERTPLIATATSFDRYNTDFSIYGRDIYLLDTDFIDLERAEIKKFRYDYYSATNTLPSVYSYLGFDHLLFFGRKLHKFGDKTGEGIRQTRYSDRHGYMMDGFDFSDSRENGVFTIRKYHGNSWLSMEDVVGN